MLAAWNGPIGEPPRAVWMEVGHASHAHVAERAEVGVTLFGSSLSMTNCLLFSTSLPMAYNEWLAGTVTFDALHGTCEFE